MCSQYFFAPGSCTNNIVISNQFAAGRSDGLYSLMHGFKAIDHTIFHNFPAQLHHPAL
jgi:hypothetical protein